VPTFALPNDVLKQRHISSARGKLEFPANIFKLVNDGAFPDIGLYC